MTLSTAAIAALARLDEIPHRASTIWLDDKGRRINAEEAHEMVEHGYAAVRTTDRGGRVLLITDEGRARLKREQEWKKP